MNHIVENYRDERGTIAVLPTDVGEHGNVLVITSKRGGRRADHWHREDGHLTYVVSGSVRYLARRAHELIYLADHYRTYGPGEAFYTASMVLHAMVFLEDSVIVVVTRSPRGQIDYEGDTVRVPVGWEKQ